MQLRVVVLLISVVTVSCTGERSFRDDPRKPADPAYPEAQIIRATHSTRETSTCCFAYPEGGGECPAIITSYGTNDSIGDVVDFYEEIGFQVKGEPGLANEEGEPDPEGELVRWVGVRSGDEIRWREVDIFTGEIGGVPEWETAFTISAPDC